MSELVRVDAAGLENLAAEINEEHRLCEAALRNGLAHALKAGEMLVEAKSHTRHGEWGSWLADNFDGSERTAQAYLRLALNWGELENRNGVADLSFRGAMKELASSVGGGVSNHRALGTGENEWYTPADVIEDVRSVLGAIQLDPASSHKAQKVVAAEHYFTAEDDALSRGWFGKVFLNPPYSRELMPRFASKLIEEVKAGRVSEAVMLTHNYTDNRWFHMAASAAQLICFTRGRIRFIEPDGELSKPTQGQAFFYYGGRPEAFRDNFSHRGLIVARIEEASAVAGWGHALYT